jgi:GntR family transcriptional regulator
VDSDDPGLRAGSPGQVTIDHLTGEPAYLQLARILREMITSGEIAPRQPMPSIKSITQHYGVAKGTAEKALGVLRDEGLVVTVPGRGIYVIDR